MDFASTVSPYSHSLRSTFPGFLFPLGYGGLKRVLACKFVFFSVFPQFSKLWVSNWYHSLVSFRLKNRLGKSDYSFQKSDTWTGTHWSVALRLKVTRRSCSSWSIFIVAQNKWLCNDGVILCRAGTPWCHRYWLPQRSISYEGLKERLLHPALSASLYLAQYQLPCGDLPCSFSCR